MSRTYRKEFDAVEFHELHTEMKAALLNLRNRKVVALVGMTGSGKSTTLNYLLGAQMEKIQTELAYSYEVKNAGATKLARIGHEGSQTLFPEGYAIDGSEKVLLDTAGLGDTRGKNVALCVSLGLQEISTHAEIEGVVIVLRQSAITDDRAKGLRELFKLVSKLASGQLNPTNVAFCLTGLHCADHATNDSVVAGILKYVENTAATMRRELDEKDSSQTHAEIEEAIAALSLMRKDNIFLMRNLENRDLQHEIQARFFAYVNSMSGLPYGLSMTIDEVTQAKLESWSKTIAYEGVAQLSREHEMAMQENALSEKLKTLSDIHHSLKTIYERSTELQDALTFHEVIRAQKISQKEAFIARKEEEQVLEDVIRIPLPKRGSGVTGLISASMRRERGGRMDRVEPKAHTHVHSKNLRDGVYMLSVSRETTNDEEARYFTAGVDVVVRVENTAHYQQSLSTLSSDIAEINATVEQLKREQKSHVEEFAQLRTKMQKIITEMKLAIRADDSIDAILMQLMEQMTLCEGQLTTLTIEKSDITARIDGNAEQYSFLAEIAKYVTFDDSIVAAFVKSYQARNTPAQPAVDNVVSLGSHRSTVFGERAQSAAHALLQTQPVKEPAAAQLAM